MDSGSPTDGWAFIYRLLFPAQVPSYILLERPPVAFMLTAFPSASTPALPHNIESPPPTSLELFKLSTLCSHQTPQAPLRLQHWTLLPCYHCGRLVTMISFNRGKWLLLGCHRRRQAPLPPAFNDTGKRLTLSRQYRPQASLAPTMARGP